MSDIQVGDVVRLKSGGPQMTVNGIDETRVYCFYFDKQGNKQTMAVQIESVKKVSFFGRLFK